MRSVPIAAKFLHHRLDWFIQRMCNEHGITLCPARFDYDWDDNTGFNFINKQSGESPDSAGLFFDEETGRCLVRKLERMPGYLILHFANIGVSTTVHISSCSMYEYEALRDRRDKRYTALTRTHS
jgi:hypothetical protein